MRLSACLIAATIAGGCTEHGFTPYRFHARIDAGSAIVTAGGVHLRELEATYRDIDEAREQLRVELHIVVDTRSRDVVVTPGYCDEEAVRLKVDFGELKLEDVRLFVDPTDLSLGSSIKTCEGTLFAVYTTP